MPTTLPAEPKVLWQIPVGEGFASPVVAGGRVFYFENVQGKETLHAITTGDHEEVWRVPVDDTFQDEQGPPGPRCTPMVDGDRVYAQSGRGELQCLRVADGQRLWRVNFLRDFGAAFLGEDSKVPGAAEHGYNGTPVIDGERLIACVGGTNDAGIVCFEKRTGKVLWKSQDDLAAYAAPMVATLAGAKQAICFTVAGLIGLDLSNGRLFWRVPIKTAWGRNCTTPVIVGDLAIAGSYQAGLIGVKISADGGGLKAEQVWVNKEAAPNFSSFIASGQHLYGLGPAKNLICVAVETGKIAWSKEGDFTTAPNVAHASLLALGKNILVCTDGGQLILLAGDPSTCRELSRAQVCGMNWCNPAYADGRLYVRDGLKATGHLYCLELLP
ncbi:MAG: PQQ-like beta-propeller repeat protein [Verrucomicrobia bacterium]|nr:PQQ-like beta-propeller repeat protein [Verrucomicrobiota bacterium]